MIMTKEPLCERDLNSSQELTLDSIICPICQEIMCLPVTMACNHEMCKSCYDFHFKLANFCCPMCKRRLSSWARKAVNQGKLINMKKWNQMQEQFPDLIKQKENGLDVVLNQFPNDKIIAAPGEIRKEYISSIKKWENEEIEKRKQEEKASMELIKQIQEEERLQQEMEKEQKIKKDEELAKKLTEELKINISPGGVNRIILRPKRKREKDPSSNKKCKQK